MTEILPSSPPMEFLFGGKKYTLTSANSIIEIPPPVIQYAKLALRQGIVGLGKAAEFSEFLNQTAAPNVTLRDFWNDAVVLEDGEETFEQAKTGLLTSGVLTEQELQSVLENAKVIRPPITPTRRGGVCPLGRGPPMWAKSGGRAW